MAWFRCATLAAAVGCIAIPQPVLAQSYSGSARLETVFATIRASYATPLDMASLADAAIAEIRRIAALDDEAWSRCTAQAAPAQVPRPPAELAGIDAALQCAALDPKDPAAADKMVDAAIGAMVAKLDARSRWLAPEAVEKPGTVARASVGLTLQRRKADVAVLRVAPDGPAGQAGIARGDAIIAIDGVATAGLSIDDILPKLRGIEDSLVTLSVQKPDGQMREVPLHRGIVRAPDLEFETERRGPVLVLRLSGMSPGTTEAVSRAIASQRNALSAVILDLRDNTGGLLSESIALADLFLDKGVIVTSRGQGKNDVEIYRARKGQVAPALPVILLVNHVSAAGAEILAAALQDNKRALVLGETSAGIGDVQTIIPVDRDHMLRLTTSHEYRADGRRLADAPVTPDCPGGGDPDRLLDAAVAIGAKGLASCPTPLAMQDSA